MESFEDRSVLVTGGLGFLGSNIARKLTQLGARVTIVESMLPDSGGNLYNIKDIKNKVTVNFSDMRDLHSLKYLVRGNDYIFNLAGQVSHIDSMTDPMSDLEINVRAQLSLLEACKENNPGTKIVYASTRQIYGKPLYLPVDETHLLQPVDVNGINKMAGEWYHILYNNVYGIRTTALRLTNCYGPGQLIKHSRQGFMGWFVRSIVEGKEIEIFGDGLQVRDLNYVDDVVEAFLLAASNERANGEVYNLGSNEPVTLKQLVELMIKAKGSGLYKLVPWPDEKKKIDIGDYRANYEKIKSELGWKAKVSLEEGLAKTIAYYSKNLHFYL